MRYCALNIIYDIRIVYCTLLKLINKFICLFFAESLVSEIELPNG